MRTAASSGQGLMGPGLVLLLTFINIANAEIIKPWKEWLCNYCAMGKCVHHEYMKRSLKCHGNLDINH